MINFLKEKIIGSHSSRKIKEYKNILQKINQKESLYKEYTSEKAALKTAEFKERIKKGESLESLIPEAFSLVRHAAMKTLKQRHFDVQVIGALALHFGNIAEMKTGEGKTLTSTLPIYLNALTGKGVHVVTVNEYLAQRDSKWMGEIFNYLGMSVGLILNNQDSETKRQAYACDITYGTNNEYGFDYLRDNMRFRAEDLVQKELNYAIVDEVDSILIDEARTPLIISGPSEAAVSDYAMIQKNVLGLSRAYRNIEKPAEKLMMQFFNVDEKGLKDRLINLKDDTVVTSGHYTMDEKSRIIQLTEEGVLLMEKRLSSVLQGKSIYDIENINSLHHVNQALKANYMFKKDIDYLVDNDQVKIVDEFTGRIMEGRRFSDGLHQALEAKENVKIQQENQTLASITFQNYFRKYKKLAGMTGTAETEKNEFAKIYNLGVVVVPTNKPMIRKDNADAIYKTKQAKYKAIVNKVKSLKQKQQPVLIGTDSIENSEILSRLLVKENIAHSILNAKNHAKEAEIIADAGKKGKVTIATNMAGRGTDIQLGEGVIETGGLFILGTVRHESRRIDLQLRGRSGRQGDVGESLFFLSLEDDLMRIFGGERIARLMTTLKINEDEAISHSLVSRAIEGAQVKVEDHNFSIRKHLLEYDDVMNRQREIIYQNRNYILTDKVKTNFENLVASLADELYEEFFANKQEDSWDLAEFKKIFKLLFNQEFPFKDEELKIKDEIKEIINKAAKELLDKKREILGSKRPELADEIERYIALSTLDARWKEHLMAIDQLKEGVGLRGYAQKNPLDEYKKEAFLLFKDLISRINRNTAQIYFRAALREESPDTQSLRRQNNNLNFRQGEMPNPSKTNGELNTKQPPKQAPVLRSAAKIGRNDPCYCNSGKKYKHCHGKIVVNA